MQVCLHTSAHRLVRVKQRETSKLYLWSSWSPHEWKRTTGAPMWSRWTNRVRKVLPKSPLNTLAHTAALNSPLLDGAANSFQMNVVYLAYWWNQLLQLTGTSHFPERQIWNFKAGEHSPPPPFQEGITALCEEGQLALHEAAQLQNHEFEEEMKASSAWRKFLEPGWLFLFS